MKIDHREENIPLIIKFEKAKRTKLCDILPHILTPTGPNTFSFDIRNIIKKLSIEANKDEMKIGVRREPEKSEPKNTFSNAVINAILIFFCRINNSITAFPIPILKKVGFIIVSII